MFIDASAIVAILTNEAESDAFSDVIQTSLKCVTSPIAIFEATLGICRKRHSTVSEAYANVLEFLAVAQVETIAVSSIDAQAALDAFARFGKGRGHPAQLNMGDCFAYASAVGRDATLLFKGDDFNKTDIRVAIL